MASTSWVHKPIPKTKWNLKQTHSRTTVGTSDYVAVANRYIDDVLSGRIVAGKWVRLACQRQRRDLDRDGIDLKWSPRRANDVCDFIEKLPHIDGRWKTPTIKLEPVQVFILTTLF